jgi:thiol-disulfide isomerase/thioredoxin
MDPIGSSAVGVVLVAGVAVGLWRRRTDGRLRDLPPTDAPLPASDQGELLDAALLRSLGVEPARATLLQFSSAFCAPCRAVRRISSEVAAMLDGVRHVEVDAESRLDAVRTLGIWRTPTLLVLDGSGRVVRRATGVPAKPQLIALLGTILTPDGTA